MHAGGGAGAENKRGGTTAMSYGGARGEEAYIAEAACPYVVVA